MMLVCGATGLLGGRVAEAFARQRIVCRVLLRPSADAQRLMQLGHQVVRGDLGDRESLAEALSGMRTVITTVNALGRRMAGDRATTIKAVDLHGNANLIAAAEEAGVQRFLFVSGAGVCEEMARRSPFASAKLHTEQRLAASSMHSIVLRPDKIQEHWLSPTTGFDYSNRSIKVLGSGNTSDAYVALDDVAAACVALALDGNPPEGVIEFGGPERLTVREVVEAFEVRLGTSFRVLHIPVPVLTLGSKLLRRVHPEIASIFGMTSYFEGHEGTWDAEPLTRLGVDARPVTSYIDELVEGIRNSG